MSVGCRSRSQLAAENLFLRKQLALYRERQVKPRRADDATRITPLPVNVQQLFAATARANATWGEERIAADLRLKLGLCVSPRTVRRYMPPGP